MKINEEEDFNYYSASKIEINDGCVKCIWLENSKTTSFDDEDCAMLSDGHNALIEFENGKEMIITNSERCSLIYIRFLEAKPQYWI